MIDERVKHELALGLIPEGIYTLTVYASGERRPMVLVSAERYEPYENYDEVASDRLYSQLCAQLKMKSI